MARPERKTVDYFPHFISGGKKMFFIEQKYGNDGYATWFKILESLASTEDHFLNLNNEMDLLFLSAKCRIKEEVLLSFLEDLRRLNEIDEFLWLNRIVYSHKFIESIQDAYSRRSNKCLTYEGFCLQYSGLCTTITQIEYKKNYNNPQSKVKKSKVNEKEEFHSSEKKKDSFNFRKALIQENFDPKLVEDWIQVRKTKRAANTETAFKIFLNQILLAERTKGIDRNELLELTVSRSWQTFKIEYLENLNQNNNAQRQQQTGAEQRRNAEQEILRRSLAGD